MHTHTHSYTVPIYTPKPVAKGDLMGIMNNLWEYPIEIEANIRHLVCQCVQV